MNESPIFSRTYDFLLWLLPQALDLQETLIAAGLRRGGERTVRLQDADTRLAQLKQTLRLCKDLELLTLKQYEHAAERLSEIGRLLGGWQKATPLSLQERGRG